jgi:hypothetical protein
MNTDLENLKWLLWNYARDPDDQDSLLYSDKHKVRDPHPDNMTEFMGIYFDESLSKWPYIELSQFDQQIRPEYKELYEMAKIELDMEEYG